MASTEEITHALIVGLRIVADEVKGIRDKDQAEQDTKAELIRLITLLSIDLAGIKKQLK